MVTAAACGGASDPVTAGPGPSAPTLLVVQSQIFTPRCAVSGCHVGASAAVRAGPVERRRLRRQPDRRPERREPGRDARPPRGLRQLVPVLEDHGEPGYRRRSDAAVRRTAVPRRHRPHRVVDRRRRELEIRRWRSFVDREIERAVEQRLAPCAPRACAGRPVLAALRRAAPRRATPEAWSLVWTSVAVHVLSPSSSCSCRGARRPSTSRRSRSRSSSPRRFRSVPEIAAAEARLRLRNRSPMPTRSRSKPEVPPPVGRRAGADDRAGHRARSGPSPRSSRRSPARPCAPASSTNRRARRSPRRTKSRSCVRRQQRVRHGSEGKRLPSTTGPRRGGGGFVAAPAARSRGSGSPGRRRPGDRLLGGSGRRRAEEARARSGPRARSTPRSRSSRGRNRSTPKRRARCGSRGTSSSPSSSRPEASSGSWAWRRDWDTGSTRPRWTRPRKFDSTPPAGTGHRWTTRRSCAWSSGLREPGRILDMRALVSLLLIWRGRSRPRRRGAHSPRA